MLMDVIKHKNMYMYIITTTTSTTHAGLVENIAPDGVQEVTAADWSHLFHASKYTAKVIIARVKKTHLAPSYCLKGESINNGICSRAPIHCNILC